MLTSITPSTPLRKGECDILIAGAGITGATIARVCADAGMKVLVAERRPVVGGNCYDEVDEHGVLVHRYGGHIFHTNHREVVDFLSRFTDWRKYEHEIMSHVGGRFVPYPVNAETTKEILGLTGEEAARYFDTLPPARRETLHDAILSSVGPKLYAALFEGYNIKQWDVHPREIPAAIGKRIPVRTTDDRRTFDDHFQAVPASGYTSMIRNMLDSPNITTLCNLDFGVACALCNARTRVYTGRIDEYCGYRFGKLPYRSLDIRFVHIPDTGTVLPCGTVNMPNNHGFCRIMEFRHMTGQDHTGTTIAIDYPCADGEPMYVIESEENRALYKRYTEWLAEVGDGTTFAGRLGEYRYYDIDDAVVSALEAGKSMIR